MGSARFHLEDSLGLEVDPEELDADDFETVDTFTTFTLAQLSGSKAA
ncbi:hypothetical protein [Streptomyces clavifer]